jgi:formimidoylglutamate deiminase
LGAIEPGCRADFAVLDEQSSALLGIPSEYVMDALVFSSPDARCNQVFVGGAQAAASGQEGTGCEVSGRDFWQRVRQDFSRTMRQLWA